MEQSKFIKFNLELSGCFDLVNFSTQAVIYCNNFKELLTEDPKLLTVD